jgi:hypothetical protein
MKTVQYDITAHEYSMFFHLGWLTSYKFKIQDYCDRLVVTVTAENAPALIQILEQKRDHHPEFYGAFLDLLYQDFSQEYSKLFSKPVASNFLLQRWSSMLHVVHAEMSDAVVACVEPTQLETVYEVAEALDLHMQGD